MDKKYVMSLGFICFLWSSQTTPMERVKEKVKEIYHYYRGTEKKQVRDEPITDMLAFITHGISDIDHRIDTHEIQQLMQTGMLKDIEVVSGSWEDDQVDSILAQFYKKALQQLESMSNRTHLQQLDEELSQVYNALEKHREDLIVFTLRIGTNLEQVSQAMRNSFKSLELAAKESGYTVYKAYEILGINPQQRSKISSDEIRSKYEKLGKLYKGKDTPLGRAVRQAGYILQSPISRQHYDAFLADYYAPQSGHAELKKLFIPEQVAKVLKIDFEVFNNFITNAKYYVGELKKAVQNRIKQLEKIKK
jgi:hypothetical protein